MDYTMSAHAWNAANVRGIKREWIALALALPTLRVDISDEERHYFTTIKEAQNRCLKVVANPRTKRIVTVYFDRNMRKKGCKDDHTVR